MEEILALEPDNEQAAMALLWVLQQQQAVDDLHSLNAEELANIAQETGAEVLRGTLQTRQAGEARTVSPPIWPDCNNGRLK